MNPASEGAGVSACPVRVLRAKDGTIAAVRVDFVPDARQLPASPKFPLISPLNNLAVVP